MLVWWLVGFLIVCFGLIVFRGAPYVPTQRKQAEVALDLLELRPGEVLVDLGSGDGVLLKAAAERGIQAHGYELNPVLCVISYLRCWRYRHLVKVHLRDFWLTPLPAHTKGIFTFLAEPFMKELTKKLEKEASGARFVSYGFMLPSRKPIRSVRGMHLYWF